MSRETQSSWIDASNSKIADNLRDVRHRIAVFSGKGGVGKTTVSVNLAFTLHAMGKRIGLLDADVTGPNVAKMLGIDGELSLGENHIIPFTRDDVKVVSVANMIKASQAVIWRGPMRSKLLQQFLGDVAWGTLDYLVADLPPGTGDEIITITQKMMPDLAIIVTTPQEVSLIDSRRAINMARKMEVRNIALVENMSGLLCPSCGREIDLFGRGGGERQAEEEGILFLGSLPIDIATRESSDKGKPIVLESKGVRVATAIRRMAERINELLDCTEKAPAA
jgi:ATP-binding protein involved in chromosome partitioning